MKRMIITFSICLSFLLIATSLVIPIPEKRLPQIKEVKISRIGPDLQFTIATDLLGMLSLNPFTAARIHTKTRGGKESITFVPSWSDLEYTYNLTTRQRIYFVIGRVTLALNRNNIEAVAVVPVKNETNSGI